MCGFIWGSLFYSIDPYVCFCASITLFWLLYLCSIVWSLEELYLQLCSFSSGLLWQFWVFCGLCDFSCFLRKVCITMNFPLRTAFAANHRFRKVVFSFSFVSRYFLISLVSLLTYWFLLVACCLVSTSSFFSHFSFCGWFPVSFHCGQKRCLK